MATVQGADDKREVVDRAKTWRDTTGQGDETELAFALALTRAGRKLLRPLSSAARYDLLMPATTRWRVRSLPPQFPGYDRCQLSPGRRCALIAQTRSAEGATAPDLVVLSQMRPRKRRIRKMITIVTINPIIPVGPRISSRSFPRELQRTAAARPALSPSWVGGRHAAQYSNRRDGSARQREPSAVVPDKLDCFNIGWIESRLPLPNPRLFAFASVR